MDMMEIYKWTAIVSGIAFLIQLGSSLIGFDADTDMDMDIPDGGDHLFGNVLLSFISVRNVVSFLLAFSITGYFGMRDYGFGPASVLPGLLAGCVLVLFNIYLMKLLSSLRRDTSVTEKELEGLEGMVIFPVLAKRSGQGKVNVNVSGNRMTLFAVTDDPEDIPKNTQVIINSVLDSWILLVSRKRDSGDPS